MPLTPETLDRTADLLTADEGIAAQRSDGLLYPYPDSLGNQTIGVGHKCLKSDPPYPWTTAQAKAVLIQDMGTAIAELNAHWPEWVDLAPARQAVCISAVFQLGIGSVENFAPTIALIKAGKYSLAASHMLNTLWERQTPARVHRLATMMSTGGFQ